MKLRAPDGEIAEVPDDQAEHFISMGAQPVREPSPEQMRRRQQIEADRAMYDAEAQNLESEAMRNLLASGAGAAASLLVPGGGGLLARGALGALGGGLGAGIEAGVRGETLPEIGSAALRGGAYGAALGPLGALGGKAAGEVGGAIGSAASRVKNSVPAQRVAAVATEIGKDIPLVKGAIKGVEKAKRIGNAAGGSSFRDAANVAAQKAERESAKMVDNIAKAAARETDPNKAAQLMRLARRAHKVTSGEVSAGSSASRVAGEIKPGPSGPVGSAANRIKGGRHEIDYYSESQGQNLKIDDMSVPHLRAALNKMGRELEGSNVHSPVARARYQALKDELTYRLKEASAKGAEYTAY